MHEFDIVTLTDKKILSFACQVNYYMVEEAHYKIKSSEMFTSDKTKFLMFPGTDKLLENVDLFDPTPLYRQVTVIFSFT